MDKEFSFNHRKLWTAINQFLINLYKPYSYDIPSNFLYSLKELNGMLS